MFIRFHPWLNCEFQVKSAAPKFLSHLAPMLYPLTFRPIFKERVWGGRNLERLYAKPLPPKVSIEIGRAHV